MRSTSIVVLVVVAAVFGLRAQEAQAAQGEARATPAVASETLRQVGGTWGIPPDDEDVYPSGSYFAVYWQEGHGIVADLLLNPKGWSCSLHSQGVSWNPAKGRFEWPDRSENATKAPCWMTAVPQGKTLLFTIRCPSKCTDDDTGARSITLERIAAERLTPPVHTVHTFCSSHDALRQQLCSSEAIQGAVVQLYDATSRAGVLAEDGTEAYPNVEKLLLDLLAACRARGGDRSCLQQELHARIRDREATLGNRQKELAEERRASQAVAYSLGTHDRDAWEGTWYMVNDEMLGDLTIQDCSGPTCQASLGGTTNYTFGYASRSGFCAVGNIDDGETMRFVDATHGFFYVLPYEVKPDEWGAGPFAEYCRIDITRAGEELHVGWRGAGCRTHCSEAAGAPHGVSGTYRPLQTPSFTCSETEDMPWDEENICGDPELARLDRDLASVFEKVRSAATGASRDQLVRAQRAWIRSRRENCDTGERRTCLAKAYRERIQELQGPTARTPPEPPRTEPPPQAEVTVDTDGPQDRQSQWGRILAVAASPDGRTIAAAGMDSIVYLWELPAGRLVRMLKGHAQEITCLTFSPDGTLIASGSEDRFVNVWDANTGSLRHRLQTTGVVRSLAFSSDAKTLISTGRDSTYPGEKKTIFVWSLEQGGRLAHAISAGLEVTAVAISPDDKTFAIGGAAGRVTVWNVGSGSQVKSLETVLPACDAHVAFSREVKTVAIGATGCLLERWPALWALGSGEMVQETGASYIPESMTAPAFSPDATILAVGTKATDPALWDAGEVVVPETTRNEISLFSAGTGKLLRTLQGHRDELWSLAFVSDKLLVSGSWDQTTRIWSVESGRLLVTLAATATGTWAAYTPEGYVNASPEAIPSLTLTRPDGNRVSKRDLQEKYYRPGIILRSLQLLDTGRAIAETGPEPKDGSVHHDPSPRARTRGHVSSDSMAGRHTSTGDIGGAEGAERRRARTPPHFFRWIGCHSRFDPMFGLKLGSLVSTYSPPRFAQTWS